MDRITTAGKRALITGITGQDGSFLAELLLSKGYEVFGVVRPSSTSPYPYFVTLKEQGRLKNIDMLDKAAIAALITEVKPDEIYNLAGQSSVGASWKDPLATLEINAAFVLSLLQAVNTIDPKIKFFQASSAEMFGNVDATIQNEDTPFHPTNPYGTSKLYAYWSVVNYRESFKLFACSGILYNHESERRRIDFVARKITDGLVRVHLGLGERLMLGNIDAKRDFGYASDYVEAMWRMLQQETPDDYVIATGVAHTVREFALAAAKALGMHIEWKGKGVDEVGIDTISGKSVIGIDPQFYRPTEAKVQLGDPSKAAKQLNWKPKVGFEQLVKIMVEADLERLKK